MVKIIYIKMSTSNYPDIYKCWASPSAFWKSWKIWDHTNYLSVVGTCTSRGSYFQSLFSYEKYNPSDSSELIWLYKIKIFFTN